MQKLTTVITESNDYSEKVIKLYESMGPVYLWHKLSDTEKDKALSEANIIAIGLSIQFDKNFLDKMPGLKVIATPTTGLNHIDMEHTAKKGIEVISLRGHADFLQNITSTAEHAWGLALSLARGLPWAFEDVKKGNWDRLKWRGHEMKNKTLGIVGLGRLGKMMSRYGNAFGMKVVASDPNVPEDKMKEYGAEKVELPELFKISDVVTLHVLLTDAVYNLAGEEHLRSMKPTALLIDTARAELIEKGMLYKALENKWIAGAGIDVMWDELPDGSHLQKDPLFEYAKTHQNLIIAPHVGGATYEAMEATQYFIGELVHKYFSEKK